MTVREEYKRIRRDNVRLIAEIVTQSELSRLTGMKRQQIHQYICAEPTRNFGDKAMQRIERGLGMPDGFLDRDRTRRELTEKLPRTALSPAARLAEFEERLTAVERALKKK